jgi:cyclopropane fatty-acyl-phospholipid synthase-like methyltransferase
VEHLTIGNAAKLYCLNWIEAYLKTQPEPISILDLGCGSGSNFAALLKRYPQVAYVGVEPSAEGIAQARRTLAGLNATLIHDYAYDAVRPKLPQPHYDVVVSFSVFEHVYQRLDYLRLVQACLKPTGYALINYDSGHFHSTYWRERVKNIVGPLLATFGNQAYYQAFVREADFRRMAQEAGLQITEAKSFNTHLKGVYKHIPEAQRPAFMQHWLEIETWMNDAAAPYDDSKASTWHTRNFILRKASS